MRISTIHSKVVTVINAAIVVTHTHIHEEWQQCPAEEGRNGVGMLGQGVANSTTILSWSHMDAREVMQGKLTRVFFASCVQLLVLHYKVTTVYLRPSDCSYVCTCVCVWCMGVHNG